MKTLLSVLFLSFLASCTTTGYTVKEAMLPNGNWIFGVYTSDTCDQLISAEKAKNGNSENEHFSIPLLNKKSMNDVIFPNNNEEMKKECIVLFKQSLTNRSKELCGNDTFSLYGCLNSENESETSGLKLLTTDSVQEYKLKCYLNCNPK